MFEIAMARMLYESMPVREQVSVPDRLNSPQIGRAHV